jgi:WD40 repeat protein
VCLAALAGLAVFAAGGLTQAGKDKKDKKDEKKVEKKDEKKVEKKEEKKVEKKEEKLPVKKEEPRDKTPPLLVLKGHADWVYSVAYSRDGKFLVTAGRDRTVRIWDAGTGKEVRLLGELPRKFDETKKPPAKEEKKKESPNAYPTGVRDAVFSPDGGRVAATTGRWSKEKKEWVGEVRISDVKSGNKVASLFGHTLDINRVAYSPDGKLLASASEDATAILWDVAAGKAKFVLKGHVGPVLDVAFNKDGSRLATAGADKTVRVWDVATGKELTADKGGLKLEGIVPPPPPGKEPKQEKKAPAGKEKKDQKAAGKDKKGPQAKGPERRDMMGVAYSPDGSKLAAGNMDGTLFLWDAAGGKLLREIKGPEGVMAIAFSPDGQRLAEGGWDDLNRVWSVATGQAELRRNGHNQTVTGVAFSPDGTRLATSGIDKLIKIWPAAPTK